ncbi:hypothetical protein DID78_01340 [Candidatus Marinamargulisbacteria bacterium SCGC AG-343-D04]|nr:hypothetical protein DID78_01340 [Candidatus Marinamargulisbacteria bacterium SCGC AG-343-D04]
MIDNKVLRFFFCTVIFISLLVGLNISVRRYQFETQKNTVEIAVSLRELRELAVVGGESIESLMTRLDKESSLTTIAIEEVTLHDFIESGKMALIKGSEIINMHRVGRLNRTLLSQVYKQGQVKPEYFYLYVSQRKDFERIKKFLKIEFGSDKVKQIKNYHILQILDTREDLVNIGLGILDSDIKLVTQFGFKPLFRLKNTTRLKAGVITSKIMSFYDPVVGSSVLFEGDSVLGYPTQLGLLKEKFEDKQIRFGAVEFFYQKGIKTLLDDLSYNVFRVHSIDVEELQEMSMGKAVNRYLRAAKERSVDMLFLHPYFNSKNELSIIDYNIVFIDKVVTGLIHNEFDIFSVEQFPKQIYIPITPFEKIVLIFSVCTTFLFCISFFKVLSLFNIFTFYLFSLGSIYTLNQFGYDLFISKCMAFFVAVLFPTLAIITQFPQEQVGEKKFVVRFFKSFVYLVKILGICLIGAILIISFLSDIVFLKGVEQFFGVKLSFLVPLVLIGLFFYLRPHRITSTFFVLRRLYYSPVRTAGLISIFAVISFFFILLIRSGNFLLLPSFYAESHLRELLESVFYVRPRTKEFLIGYPFLILSFMFVDEKISRVWIWFFNILGSISLVSVINSFCHIHTPLFISLYRTVLGLLFGIAMTLIYFFLYRLFRSVFLRKLSLRK